MEGDSKFTRFKTHIKTNKGIYIGSAIGAAGVAAGVILGHQRVNNKQLVLAFKTRDVIQNVVIQANFGKRGRPGHMLQHVQSGRMFGSITEAAEELGLSTSDISRHLKGVREHVNGNTFVKLISPEKCPT